MLETIFTPSLFISFAFFLFIIIGENLYKRSFNNQESPADQSTNIKRIFKNVGFGCTYRLIFIPFVIAPITHHISVTNHLFLYENNNSLIHFFISFLLFDFMNYFTHFLSHRVKFLWKFHVVHHLDKKIDSSTGFRQHFGEKIFILPFKIIVILLFSMTQEEVFLIELISFCNGLLHHSTLRWNKKLEAFLCNFLALPAFHVVHHCNKVPYMHSNYGFIFSFWDRIFKTVSVNSIYKIENPTFGIGKCKDGSFFGLLFKPFYSKLPY